MTYYQNWPLDKKDVSDLYAGEMDRWTQIKNSGALNCSNGSAIATAIFSNEFIAGAGNHANNSLDDFLAHQYSIGIYRCCVGANLTKLYKMGRRGTMNWMNIAYVTNKSISKTEKGKQYGYV